MLCDGGKPAHTLRPSDDLRKAPISTRKSFKSGSPKLAEATASRRRWNRRTRPQDEGIIGLLLLEHSCRYPTSRPPLPQTPAEPMRVVGSAPIFISPTGAEWALCRSDFRAVAHRQRRGRCRGPAATSRPHLSGSLTKMLDILASAAACDSSIQASQANSPRHFWSFAGVHPEEDGSSEPTPALGRRATRGSGR
jgi:hypothetical protein